MISSAHSLESTADGFHNTLILTLAESLAAVGKIEEALDEASQAGNFSKKFFLQKNFKNF